MVNSIYQILLLGCNKELLPVVRSKLEKSLSDMQITDESYKFINTETFEEESLGVNPTIALYFTSDVNSDKDINLISTLKKHSIFIIPIVDSFDNAGLLLPDSLKEINAARVVDKNDEEGIVEVINHVLSNLGLLTKERNVFISYKRVDSQTLAHQLYDKFLLSGFSVFLDTESLSAGVNFQKSLRHRLADSFVLILLNSEHFFDKESKWTLEEYHVAQSLQIGICSIMMPSVKVKRDLNFSDFLRLEPFDFTGKKIKILKEQKVNEIVLHVKSIYARLYESRKKALVNAFTENLRKNDISFSLQIDGSILIESPKQRCRVIPLIGIPKSWDYYISDIKRAKGYGLPMYLLYNNQCILDEWLEHLAWLENKSGIQAINVNENQSWIQINL